MTVAELIGQLREFPPDMKVFTWGGGYENELEQVHNFETRQNPDLYTIKEEVLVLL